MLWQVPLVVVCENNGGAISVPTEKSQATPDIADRAGDMDWLSLGWMMGAMIAAALAAMCFVAQWVLRPRSTSSAQGPADTHSR